MWFNKRIKTSDFLIIMVLITLLFLLLPGFVGKKLIRSDPEKRKPLLESQIIDLSVESEIMERSMPVRVYLPKGYGDGKDYPVWYGLHGYSSDESMWTDAGFTEVADELIHSGAIKPMIMVFPFVKDDALKEFNKQLKEYGKLGERYIDQYISRELIPYIDSNYDTVTASKGRYIGGFSMGGMMALRIAFLHPELFSKVGGYSAAVTSDDFSGTQLENWLFPDEKSDEISDVVRYARKKGLNRLKVYLDWGNENDPFSEGLQSLTDALKKRKISSEFKINDGGHNLIPDNFPDYLKFYSAE